MFWAKIVCERCNRKNRESRSVYSRGSYFCSDACLDAWSKDNPPPVAKGSVEALRQETAIIIDAALDEFHRVFGLTPRKKVETTGQAIAQLVGSFGNINATHRAIEQNESLIHFHTDVLRCAPLLRGLGHTEAAAMIESTDIMKVVRSSMTMGHACQRLRPLAETLERVRPS